MATDETFGDESGQVRTGWTTVDLNKNVTGEQRQAFYDHLAKAYWTKIQALTTAWQCSFKDGVTDTDAISTVRADVEAASIAAGKIAFDAAVEIGSIAPDVFKKA